MIYLPEPWEGELLSSALTRGAKCFGRDSRMMSLAHFGERCLCHPQYPKHVPTFAELWGERWTTEELIANHTLYPLTAPFVEPELRERLLDWMHGNPSGRRRVSGRMLEGTLLSTYRYCPKCWAEQERTSRGDQGWLRAWQVPGNRICLRHGEALMDTGESFRDRFGANRNIEWSVIDLSKARPLAAQKHDEELSRTICRLLGRPLEHLPTSEQWKSYWDNRLAEISAAELSDAGAEYWGPDWLVEMGIEKISRRVIEGTRSRVWWRHLLLLKAVDPQADLVEAINTAAKIKTDIKVKDNN